MSTYLAIPSRGNINSRIADAHWEAATSLDTQPVIHVSHLSVGANRQTICHAFLQTPAHTLVMIDDDVRPPANLQPLVDSLHKYPIVGAAYPIFKPELWGLPVIAAFHENDLGQLAPIRETTGTHRVDIVGTGCIAIRRNVVEDLAHTFKETVRQGNITSDDVNFCHAARDYGYHIAVNLDVRCDHITTVSLGAVLQGSLTPTYA